MKSLNEKKIGGKIVLKNQLTEIDLCLKDRFYQG